jgi:uncharacterized protein (PEP-CTERM system associated)
MRSTWRLALLSSGLASVAADVVFAQLVTPVDGGGYSNAPSAAAIGTVPAQANGRGFSIVPSVAVTETLSDNIRLSSTDRQTDLVTQITPAIRITSNGGRIRGFVDYSFSGLVYARNSSGNEVQNFLNSAVKVEAVENWAFIDASASVTQQYVSAYGTQSADSTVINSNRTEVRTFTVSPYAKGKLAASIDYEARLTQNWTRNSTSDAANYDDSLATVRVQGDSRLRAVSWSADASMQVYDYTIGRRTEDDRIRGFLYFTVNPQLRLSLSGGLESSNISTINKETNSTPGIGIEWNPTERTLLAAQYEKRFFGSSHALKFEHRTPRTVWRYTDTRDVENGFGQPAAGQPGTAYDLFFAQFASVQPDPGLRASLVDQFLRSNGIAPTAQVYSGSLATAPTEQRRQDLAFAFLGVRDTITVVGSQTRGRRIDPLSTTVDDFANNNLVRQRGVSLGLSHRMTPLAALNLVTSIDRTSGSVASQETTLRTVRLYWTDQFGPRGDYSMGVRHASFSSAVAPYTETAVMARLGLRF